MCVFVVCCLVLRSRSRRGSPLQECRKRTRKALDKMRCLWKISRTMSALGMAVMGRGGSSFAVPRRCLFTRACPRAASFSKMLFFSYFWECECECRFDVQNISQKIICCFLTGFNFFYLRRNCSAGMCRNGVDPTHQLIRRFVIEKICVPKPVASNQVILGAIAITLGDVFKGGEHDRLYDLFLHLHRSPGVGPKWRTVTVDLRKFALNRVSCNVFLFFFCRRQCWSFLSISIFFVRRFSQVLPPTRQGQLSAKILSSKVKSAQAQVAAFCAFVSEFTFSGASDEDETEAEKTARYFNWNTQMVSILDMCVAAHF